MSDSDIETQDQIRARLTAQKMAESDDPVAQTVGLTALQVTAIVKELRGIKRGLWTEDTMRRWIRDEIRKENKPKTSFGRVLAVISDTRLLLVIILALVILLGKTLQVNVSKEVSQTANAGLISKGLNE